jgi:hypothetical protein
MVGAGLLSLPWALAQLSWGVGIVALVMIAVLNAASLLIIARHVAPSGSALRCSPL